MITIWKLPLSISKRNIVMVPRNSQPLTVQIQNGVPCLWVTCDDANAPEPPTITCVGTGHPMPLTGVHAYIGTTQSGRFVWHWFLEERA